MCNRTMGEGIVEEQRGGAVIESKGDRSGKRKKEGPLPAGPSFTSSHGLGAIPETPGTECIMKDRDIKNADVF